MSTRRRALVLAAGSLIASSVVFAQAQKEQFAKAQKDNAAALRQYTWKNRTEIKLKGESKSVKLEQERYDIDGNIEKTDLGEPAPQAQPEQGGGHRRGGRLKEKVVEKKKDEFADLLQNLGKLVGSYAHMPPDKMQAFAAGATLTPNQGDNKDQLLIQGKNALQPGDSMSVWVDAKTFMMRTIQIETSYEQKPVHFKGDFQPLQTGPTYPARLDLQYPDKQVELLVEKYDYQKLGQ